VTRKRMVQLSLLFALLVWPFLSSSSSLVGNANTAGLFFLPAVSLVMLTGWVGQVSLAQASFVGIGAYICAMATRDWGIPFPLNVPAGALAAAGAAALLGLVALRVRGLFLAVATLIFAWATDAYLFTASWMGGVGGATEATVKPVGNRDRLPYLDFSERRTFYFVVLAACAFATFALLNVRDTKMGRALFAVRGSEIAAASFGIDVVRAKLTAFALSGFVAGLAGSLLIVHQGAVVSDQFNLSQSLFYLSVAVVGGLTSVGGAAAAAILFAGLDQLFFQVDAFAGYLDVASAVLLAAVLLAYPGGLAALGARIAGIFGGEGTSPRRGGALLMAARRLGQRALRTVSSIARAERRMPEANEVDDDDDERVTVVEIAAPPPAEIVFDASDRRVAETVLAASGVTVKFGGLTAASDVSIEVRRGEIVGLIGPNGAGKTTVFNAISGLNQPTAGTIAIAGTDATRLPVHRRAGLGLARTFQVIQLFPQMTVRDNLLVGAHLHGRSGLLRTIALTKGAVVDELEAVARVESVTELLGLTDIADRPIGGLPFGVLRMVELARAVVSGAGVIMLDEPASGLDNAETDRLSELLRMIRRELGVSLLLIEHDVRMVTALTDYMYVLDQGCLIAQGTPAAVQRDPAVIAAYLGEAPAPQTEEVSV